MSTQSVIVALIALLGSFAARFVPAVKLRQWIWLLASYYLYASLAGPKFLALLIASSLMNYVCAVLVRRRPTLARLWFGIAANVLLLVFFKYLPALANVWPAPFAEMDFVHRIILPLGVSFWTFQALSYLFDSYLEEEVTPSALEFCLYMAFWPTVALGPVCRLTRMLPQFRKLPGSVREDLKAGAIRLIEGLFMKLVLSQLLVNGIAAGIGVSGGFDTVGVERGALDVWLLAFGYGFQLFFDFAGYSNIVIGAARLFGVRLEENFNRPYLATTPAVFWTRWHMSLSFWIRDYLYTPLSTLRRSQWWRYTALVITMVVFGFWHNAQMTLVLWGFYNGLVLVGHRLGQQLTRRLPIQLPKPLGALLSWAATFSLICLSYVFFRANSLGQSLHMLHTVLTPHAYRAGSSTMPIEDYWLIGLMIGGYFAYVGLSALTLRWVAYYQTALQTRTPSFLDTPQAARVSTGWLALWIFEELSARKWWVLIPVLALLLTIIGMSFLQNANTAPFVYQHF